MPTIAGLRGTGSFGVDERPKNFREMILWMNPNGRSPLFALMAKMKKETTDDPEFAWWEEGLDIVRSETDGEHLAGATTITLASGGNKLVPGDILQVELDVEDYSNVELLRVTAVNSDTEIEVDRGVAGSTAATIDTGSFLQRIGSVDREGGISPETVSRNPIKLRNFTQIFKTAFQVSNTAIATRYRTGDVLANERKRKSFDHSEKIEQSLLWGKAHESVIDGQPARYTGGLRQFLTTNNHVYTSNPTEALFLEQLSALFDREADGAGNERIAMCGNGFLNTMNHLARSESSTRINFNGVLETYGMRLLHYTIPQGELYLHTHPLMNVHPVYRYSAFIITPPGLVWRPLRGRDTSVEENIQPKDADFRKDQWLTEGGLEVHHESTMAYFGGFHLDHE